jgi:hypothetical protein
MSAAVAVGAWMSMFLCGFVVRAARRSSTSASRITTARSTAAKAVRETRCVSRKRAISGAEKVVSTTRRATPTTALA